MSIKMAAANLFGIGIVIYCFCLCRSYRRKVDITVYSDWSDNEEDSDGNHEDSVEPLNEEDEDEINQEDKDEYNADITII